MVQPIEVLVLGRLYKLLIVITIAAAVSIALDLQSLILLFPLSVVALSVVALLMVFSRFETLEFDGQAIARRGLFSFIESKIFKKNRRLEVGSVELAACAAIRSPRGFQRVRYYYKLMVVGASMQFSIPFVGGRNSAYLDLVKSLLNSLEENKLDPRSSELKQYLNSVRPEKELLETARKIELIETNAEFFERLPLSVLRQLANNMKMEGLMQQAYQCFVVARKRDPYNPYLLYEMARFLNSLGAISHPRLLSRSKACLRAAAYIGKDDPKLLLRIAETYCEYMQYKTAVRCFFKALNLDPNLFRADIGLAKIAVDENRLAQAAHYFNAAARVSLDSAQRSLANREAGYYERLASDEDYFEAELNRITKLETVQWVRNWSSLMLFVFWLAALLSGRFSIELGKFAWFAVFSTSLVWLCSSLLLFRYNRRHH